MAKVSAKPVRKTAVVKKAAKAVRTGTAKKADVKAAASKKAAAGKAKKGSPASKRRGLIIFSIIAGIVIVFAVVEKILQGPPVKMLPVQVLATFAVTDEKQPPLSSPRGVAVDNDGNVYVSDLGNHRVVKFGPDGSLLLSWGKKGSAAGEFNEPSGLAVDAAGFVYVADAWNGRVQKFNGQGEYMGEISAKTGNFYSPRNVTVDNNGYIYVADTGNSCVKKFDNDANLVKRWGEFGTGRMRFQETFGLWVDKDNQVYVGDAGNKRVKVYTTDGHFVRELRVKGWQNGNGWPMVAVDPSGRIFATDVQNNMVWMYSKAGKYLGSWGNQPGKDYFGSPLGLAFDNQGAVYVSNMNRGQVLKLAAPEK